MACCNPTVVFAHLIGLRTSDDQRRVRKSGPGAKRIPSSPERRVLRSGRSDHDLVSQWNQLLTKANKIAGITCWSIPPAQDSHSCSSADTSTNEPENEAAARPSDAEPSEPDSSHQMITAPLFGNSRLEETASFLGHPKHVLKIDDALLAMFYDGVPHAHRRQVCATFG